MTTHNATCNECGHPVAFPSRLARFNDDGTFERYMRGYCLAHSRNNAWIDIRPSDDQHDYGCGICGCDSATASVSWAVGDFSQDGDGPNLFFEAYIGERPTDEDYYVDWDDFLNWAITSILHWQEANGRGPFLAENGATPTTLDVVSAERYASAHASLSDSLALNDLSCDTCSTFIDYDYT